MRQAEAARKSEIGAAIAEIKAKMAAYGITLDDLGGKAKAARGRKPKVGKAAKAAKTGKAKVAKAAQAGGSKVPQCRDRGNLVRARQGAQVAGGAGGSGAQA